LKNNKLLARIVSAFFFLIAIAISFLNQYAFLIIFEISMLLCLLEFYKLTEKAEYYPKKWFGLIFSGLLFFYIFLTRIEVLKIGWSYYILALAFLSFSIELLRKGSAVKNLSVEFLGIFYIAVPFALTNFVVFWNNTFDYKLLSGIFLIIWTYDVAAYFVGISIGKRKIFINISPNKTLEGTLGGIILGISASVAIFNIFKIYTLFDWLIIAVLCVFGAFIGDLVESKIKRSVNVKDSGKIMPGHGGLLDRFDSFLLAIVAVNLYLFLVKLI